MSEWVNPSRWPDPTGYAAWQSEDYLPMQLGESVEESVERHGRGRAMMRVRQTLAPGGFMRGELEPWARLDRMPLRDRSLLGALSRVSGVGAGVVWAELVERLVQSLSVSGRGGPGGRGPITPVGLSEKTVLRRGLGDNGIWSPWLMTHTGLREQVMLRDQCDRLRWEDLPEWATVGAALVIGKRLDVLRREGEDDAAVFASLDNGVLVGGELIELQELALRDWFAVVGVRARGWKVGMA